ncbi:MAG TPA: VTT domain-containing protein [Casimicrobiaceae bacterium]|nr:VTT domain-containing protein [Casimicrobiaceae bacterium]
MLAAAFIESLALIGTIVPGGTIVFMAGVLAGLHALDPWLAAVLAITGAILGDGISYTLGRRYAGTVRATPLLLRHPGLFARGEAYFEVNGRKGVFLGRFLGPLRAVVPLIAGMSRMPPRDFFTIDAVSAVAWAAAHLLPGVLFGASLQLAGAVSSRLVVLVALLVAGLWLITLVTRAATRRGWPYLVRLRDRLLVRADAASGPLSRAVRDLLDPGRHEALALLISATLLVAGAWLFLGVVEDVVTQDTLVDVDRAMYAALQGVRTRWADEVMVTVTELASAHVVIAVIAAVGAWFAITRRFRTLAYWLTAAGVAEVLVWGLKSGFERARPATPYAAIDEFSFPSGHAAISMVVYGFLAFLIGHRKPVSKQTLLALGAVAIAALVAFSRLYLGAHWLSDVIASFGLAIAWVALLGIAYIPRVDEGTMRAAPVLSIVIATLAFVGGPYAANHHQRDMKRYAMSVERPVLTVDAWQAGAWASLPAARIDIGGEREEPFSVQWTAAREEITDALRSVGWVTPARWRSSAALLWLLPATPIRELPVLPKFDQGQPPVLTFIQPVDVNTRTVLRLWHPADAIDALSRRVPIWIGMITTERKRSQWRLMAVTRTEPRLPAPDEALAHAVRGRKTALVRRSTGEETVLLVR